MSTLEVLRHLTASCRYQHPPGAPLVRKYDHLCLAAITLPLARPTKPLPPGVPFTIEVWKEAGGCVEAQLAVIYPIAMARAAFEAACELWPKHEVTLRDRCRIVERRERLEMPATSAPSTDPDGPAAKR